MAVLASHEPGKVAALASVVGGADFTEAQGRWRRVDGGEEFQPNAVSIDCTRDDDRCIEATSTMNDGYMGTPSSDVYLATFTPQAITYENSTPLCVDYSVRIDLELKKVFAVRRSKAGASSNKLCDGLERSIEMTLGDGYQKGDPFAAEGHFLPILSTIGSFSTR